MLDEPVELERNARLVVTVLPGDSDRDAWLRMSVNQLMPPTTVTAMTIRLIQ
ncbi:MAG: hypothetical protein ACT4OT_05595 [Acidobacteriota bacterium]